MKIAPLIFASALLPALACAQDAARGARLFADTAALTGKPVASCAACHADVHTLRAQIEMHGGRPDELPALTRWLAAVFDGAQPGAAHAKAQYRGVLKSADVRDLAAYIARARQATAARPALAEVTGN